SSGNPDLGPPALLGGVFQASGLLNEQKPVTAAVNRLDHNRRIQLGPGGPYVNFKLARQPSIYITAIV
ncbi:MAG: hypothetical protein WBB22_09350, partial [Anaerolineae bacterium]